MSTVSFVVIDNREKPIQRAIPIVYCKKLFVHYNEHNGD